MKEKATLYSYQTCTEVNSLSTGWGERATEERQTVREEKREGGQAMTFALFHFLNVTFFQMPGSLEVPHQPDGPWLRPPGRPLLMLLLLHCHHQS